MRRFDPDPRLQNFNNLRPLVNTRFDQRSVCVRASLYIPPIARDKNAMGGVRVHGKGKGKSRFPSEMTNKKRTDEEGA